MVHFLGLEVIDEIGDLFAVHEVAIVQEEAGSRVVGILIDMIDAVRVEGARTPHEAVDFIAFREEEFGQIGTVLTSDTRDEGALWHNSSCVCGVVGVMHQ
jgi:hypothetical protein